MARSIINLADFSSKETVKKAPGFAFRGILYANGYQVATDTVIMVAINRPYPEEHEGKVIDEGEIKDMKHPFSINNVLSVLPEKLKKWEQTPIDFKMIETWYSEELIPWRKTQTNKKDEIWRGRVQISNAQYDATYMQKFLRTAKKIKAKDFYLSPIGNAPEARKLYAFGELDGEKVQLVLMSCMHIETKTLIIQ